MAFQKKDPVRQARVKELRAEGKTLKAIAEEVGAPLSTVAHDLKGASKQGKRNHQLQMMRKVVASKNADNDGPEMARYRRWMDQKWDSFIAKKTFLEGKEMLARKGIQDEELASGGSGVIEKDEGTRRCVDICVEWMRKRQE